MSYSDSDFFRDVFNAVKSKKVLSPTEEECRAVAHHMEFNIRADVRRANNGHLRISWDDAKRDIVNQIYQNLHSNDIPRYVEQYRQYKSYQKNWHLTAPEENDLRSIACGYKKVSDFKDKDYLKNLYIKYFNQRILPEIRKISLQEKNKLKYHGLWHTEQVALFAIDISVEDNLNPLNNLLAAALHDCARSNDGPDIHHAENCRPIATNFLNNIYQDKDLLTLRDKDNIIHAVVNHNVPTRDKSNTVLNCLQDADSMRLWWKRGPRYSANTATGEKLATYSGWQQIKYMANMLERMRAFTPPYGTPQRTPLFKNPFNTGR